MRFLVIALLVGGCATVTPVAPTVPVGSKRFEEVPLPPDPSSELLPSGTPEGDWVEPLEPGYCLNQAGKMPPDATLPCPARGGILVSEARAVRDGMYRMRYKELRLNYEADRRVFAAQRELYEGRLADANTKLMEAQPSWLQRHGLELGLVGGTVLGTAATIAIVYGLTQPIKEVRTVP